MTRAMGDDDGPVEVRPAYSERLDAVLNEATRAYVLNGWARPDDFDSDGIELDWAGLEGFILAMTRTPMGRFNYLVEHDLCPFHECDYEICLDDEPEECAAFWALMRRTGREA